MSLMARSRKIIKTCEERSTRADRPDHSRYASDPVGYASEVLGVRLWPKQEEIARLLLEPPYRVLVKASHSTGKTFVSAVLTNWWYDTRDPGCVITTAPTARDVRDLLWTEIRLQRAAAPPLANGASLPSDFAGDAAPEMRTGPDHFAKGFTARKGESFQGRHRRRMLFVFDEAVGVDAKFWATTRTMFQPTGEHGWVCIYNPTDTSSQAHQEELLTDEDGSPAWHVVEMASPEHPNIAADLAGLPQPFPGAVSLAQFEDWLGSWSEPIEAGDAAATDLEWPPGSGRWYRPGPLMESRALGRWPSGSTYGVWSEAAWAAAVAVREQKWVEPGSVLPEIGCDVARHGDDYTEMHVRWGDRSTHHERHNGWGTDRTALRLVEMCREWAERATRARPTGAAPITPQQIAVKVDADGLGVGVVDQRQGHRFLPVCGSGRPLAPDEYVNRRAELWFTTARLARAGKLDLSGLPRDVRQRLRQQAMTPMWWPQSGKCRVEEKIEIKRRLGFSPDAMDAMNLAYCPAGGLGVPQPAGPARDPRGNLDPATRNANGGAFAGGGRPNLFGQRR